METLGRFLEAMRAVVGLDEHSDNKIVVPRVSERGAAAAEWRTECFKRAQEQHGIRPQGQTEARAEDNHLVPLHSDLLVPPSASQAAEPVPRAFVQDAISEYVD